MNKTNKEHKEKFLEADSELIRLMSLYGPNILRLSLGIVFFWFGMLKFFPGLSPAESLVRNSVSFIFNPDYFLPVLAAWEVLIGIGFLTGKFMRITILLLFLQMPGTLLPLFLVPDVVWTSFPFGLTLEGQYIIKNMVLVGAALIVGAGVRPFKK